MFKAYLHGCQAFNDRVLSSELSDDETKDLAEDILVAVSWSKLATKIGKKIMSNLPSYGCNCNEQGFPTRILACFEELVQLGKDYFCSCISLIAMEFIIAN